ncbi:hypothetical protein DL765_000971 [Monosporascus sp. GIB2]|nr:hypothetical protein DL765_000971 [Monosporascus sp. GIB2]
MGSWTAFLLAYLLGGVTFIPLVVVVVLVHAHLTFPVRDEPQSDKPDDGVDDIVQPGDDTTALEAAQKEEPKQRFSDGSDVAAGYFAVCREYTPMGINAKPIERPTPVGSTTVAPPSQSVYQSMYRSIFDRKQPTGPLDDHKSASQRPKKAGNVFYVVLRHGHLMLFDDEEQIEVRHVVSLALHDVSIYSGGDRTPEGELFIKRNALCLTRRADGKRLAPDAQVSKPFYLFSENCSAKEDFYFCLLRNQDKTFGSQKVAPTPQRFEVRNIISLVQKLHSSEEHMQTRWLNAFIGRVFLGLYKTKDAENYIREKLTKKISRVNRPSFLTKIAIQNIDIGESPPFVTNPRLRDLNVEGECVMESDVKYTGSFRLEVAAVARIDLGARLKAREVNLVLAVVLRKLEGHLLFKIKPPPSNRIWFSFQSMPKMEMSVEPIVSSRQITYTVILRQIENRIKEVVAETLVAPFWDDIPFFNTEHKQWRGGIFEGDDAVQHSEDHEEIAAQLGHGDEINRMESPGSTSTSSFEAPPLDKSHSLPVLENAQNTGFWNRLKSQKATLANGGQLSSASTTALDTKIPQNTNADRTPRHIRTGSFTASSPIVGTDPTHAEPFKPSSPPERDDAVSTIANLSAKSWHSSPTQTPAGSPSKPPLIAKASSISSSGSSSDIIGEEPENEFTPKAQGRRHTTSSAASSPTDSSARAASPATSGKSIKSGTSSISRGFFARKEPTPPVSGNETPEPRRGTLSAMSTAAATAKRWGLNAIQRQNERNGNGRKLSDTPVNLNEPMGRGQPLPPPGTPLPGPTSRSTPILVPKRKPVAPPPIPGRQSSTTSLEDARPERRPVPPPPLPRRRRISQAHEAEGDEENVLVVEAPEETPPVTPLEEESAAYVQPWVEDAEEFGGKEDQPIPEEQASLSAPAPPPEVVVSEHRSQAANTRAGAAEGKEGDDDEEGYSNWIDDNPEFRSEDRGALTAGS